MTERKTLNKYYPIDFDPSKIPKLKAKQKEQNRLWGIRVMAPFNMKCNTCGEYVYKGKKFNSKKETVEDEDYLGIQIHRFYIRCPKCVAVIAFKTDPENCDYTLEAGATRNFEAAKTLMDMEKKKQKEIEDEEAANPMKVLENRTKQSRNEMDMMEALTELRELNARHEKVDHEGMIKKMELYQKELARLQKEEEDRLVRELYGATEAESSDKDLVRRIEDDSDSDGDSKPLAAKRSKMTPSKPTDFLTDEKLIPSAKSNSLKKPTSTKALLSSLVRVKKSSTSNTVSTAQKSGESGSSLTAPQPQGDTTKSTQGAEKTTPNNALGMLGSYSSSETDSD